MQLSPQRTRAPRHPYFVEGVDTDAITWLESFGFESRNELPDRRTSCSRRNETRGIIHVDENLA